MRAHGNRHGGSSHVRAHLTLLGQEEQTSALLSHLVAPCGPKDDAQSSLTWHLRTSPSLFL